LLVAAPSAGQDGPVELALPALFGDHMVLQRDDNVPVWGTAPAGSEVAVRLAHQHAVTRAGDDGAWRIDLEPLPAGGPHELVVEAAGETRRFSDVLVGEVWLASGQSNMEMPLAGWGKILDYETEISRADYPQIRLFQVQRATAMQPQSDVATEGWKRCGPETVAEFSAVAYVFGRRLHREIGVPVGLIHTSWGGTLAEAWTGRETLEPMEDFRAAVREVAETTPADLAEMGRIREEEIATRRKALAEAKQSDADGVPLWAGIEVDDSAWSVRELPLDFTQESQMQLGGALWFRRRVEIPRDWLGSELALSLGFIEEEDETFFNGTPIGTTSGWQPRRYVVPPGLVREGSNVIAVRNADLGSFGGIWGDAEDFALEGPDGDTIPLAGPWLHRAGLELGPLPQRPDDPHRPSVLYNAMIAPLAPYAIRGAIWYQGESNVDRAYQYQTLFPALIGDWRRTWGREDLPFYFVQLAAFLATADEPGESAWAELREAQSMALALPQTGMAVAIDIGDAKDIHPKNKQDVGNRLARLALARTYGADVADSGPLYQSMTRQGSRIRLDFEHTRGGLEARGGALKGFAIAGADRVFRWAEARIEGNAVVVWSDEIPDPVAIRYGWADNPICNLTNAAGLPASPFRTDDWPGVTRNGGSAAD
jgi:sialate O-acetylesterase